MIGYACINMELSDKGVMINRSMIKKTFQQKGLSYVSELTIKNLTDLQKILKWNVKNNILLYRMSSDMFPWMSEYQIQTLPNFTKINSLLKEIGQYSHDNNLRLTFHPGPFNKLASDKSDVVNKTIYELNQHAEIMDLMGLSQTHFNKINIHIGGTYGDKITTMDRFAKNFNLLNQATKNRLTIENDDTTKQYTVSDLIYLHNLINIPIVFDYFHHTLNTGGLTHNEAFKLAYNTWGSVKPVFHLSSSKKLNEDNTARNNAHADFIYEPLDMFGYDVDVVLEAKAKEQAVKKLLTF
jgi:UV DNA damage endonuclease